MKAWTSGVSNTLGDAGLNLLINNAGILTPGPMEVLPPTPSGTNSTSMCLAPSRS